MPNTVRVRARINDEDIEFLCDPHQSLLEVLYDTLWLTGTKERCNNGNCGACSIIIDGMLGNSCLVLGVEAQGKTILTIDEMSQSSGLGLHPIQQQFLKHIALQCGICTTGLIVATKTLLEHNPNPSDHEARQWLADNLCCRTGYDKVVHAVLEATKMMKETT